MRVLFLCPFVPQLERHDALYHLQLLSRQHLVTLVLLYSRDADLNTLKELKISLHRVCALRLSRARSVASCAARAPTRWPLYLAYYYDAALMQAIRQIAAEERPDVVHAHTLRMATYAAGVDAPLKVCNTQDVLTTRYRGYLGRPSVGWPLDFEEWLKLKSFEPGLWRRMDRIGVVSEEEAKDAEQISPGVNACVIRPGIDPEYFKPADDRERGPSIVFLGRFSYRPNIEAALEIACGIFPLVRRRTPAARLTLVGSDPPPRIRRLAGHAGVEVTGWVADVRPYLGRAALALAPMTMSGGVKNKVLQPLAMATPVVTNGFGIRGTGLKPGTEAVVVEGTQALADACVELLDDPERCRRIGAAGRAAVVRGHAWDVVAESLEVFHRP